MATVLTVGKLKIGTVFRKWDDKICRLEDKTMSACYIMPQGENAYPVAYGCEIIEILPDETFIRRDEMARKTEIEAQYKDGHFVGQVILTICQKPEGCATGFVPGKPTIGSGANAFPVPCRNCIGPVMFHRLATLDGIAHLTFKDGVLIEVSEPDAPPLPEEPAPVEAAPAKKKAKKKRPPKEMESISTPKKKG